MHDFPGKDWENMVRKQQQVEREQYFKRLKEIPEVVVIAQWIGQSGYWHHVKDNERLWRLCLSEADGLLEHLRKGGFKVVKNA